MHTTAFPLSEAPARRMPPRASTDIGLSKESNNEFSLASADDLEYFAEGKSNVLYKYIGDDEDLKTRLIRFRKLSTSSSKVKTTTTTSSSQQTHATLQTTYIPLLSAYVVQTDLVSLPPNLIKTLNTRLPTYSKSQRDCCILDENEEFALAVEDMSPGIYQRHNEILHNRIARRRRQFPFLSPKSSNTSLISNGIDDDLDSGVNSEVEDELTITTGRGGGKKGNNKLPIPNKKDLDPKRLSSHNWRDLLTVNFTPGNLLQPDRAPPGWSVCRDCAVRHMHASTIPPPSTAAAAVVVDDSSSSGASDCSSDDNSGNNNHTAHTYCPLSLISTDPSRVREAIEAIISSHDTVTILDEQEVIVNDPALGTEGISPWLDVLEYSIVDILAGYFYDGGSIGRVLQEVQKRKGMKGGGGGVEGCRVFVRMWMRNKEDEDEGNYEVHIECKVGGLGEVEEVEVEGEDGEVEKEEEKLLRGGWYLGRGKGVNGKICRE